MSAGGISRESYVNWKSLTIVNGERLAGCYGEGLVSGDFADNQRGCTIVEDFKILSSFFGNNAEVNGSRR